MWMLAGGYLIGGLLTNLMISRLTAWLETRDSDGSSQIKAEREHRVVFFGTRMIFWPVVAAMMMGAAVTQVAINLRRRRRHYAAVRTSLAERGVYFEVDEATKFVVVDWFFKHECPDRRDFLDRQVMPASIFDTAAKMRRLPYQWVLLDIGGPDERIDCICELCDDIVEDVTNVEEPPSMPMVAGGVLDSVPAN